MVVTAGGGDTCIGCGVTTLLVVDGSRGVGNVSGVGCGIRGGVGGTGAGCVVGVVVGGDGCGTFHVTVVGCGVGGVTCVGLSTCNVIVKN